MLAARRVEPSASNLLFYVQSDTEWVTAIRDGRFAIPADMALSPHHRKAAILQNWGLMLVGLEKKGWTWLGDKPEVDGPLEHLEFSEDGTPDPGLLPQTQRQVFDPAERERWERAEKARVAKQLGLYVPMVDFILKARFKRRARKTFHRA
jgi:hypothetical protein